MDNRPIGIFDSGLGGLTVLSTAMNMIPEENMIYFGDSGRAPYGTKSEEVIIKYTFQDINFLLSNNVKLIVIGCNTASACSLDMVLKNIKTPVIDVVEPGAAAAARLTRNGRIGVIGTSATISSKVYETAVKNINPNAQIYAKACSMLVPLVEEGWWNNDIAERICNEYLGELKDKDIDTLILGCTHYPLLKDTIAKVMGPGVTLVNSAVEVSKVIKSTLERLDLCYSGTNDEQNNKSKYEFYTSDSIDKFKSLGSIFLKRDIQNAKKADIEKY